MDGRSCFRKERTVKVCGVWQLLQDQIEKEFQTKANSTGYADDVNNLRVCPNGEDYILVEFLNDISDPNLIGKTLKIDGTDLKVEKWERSTASSENLKSKNDNSSVAKSLFQETKVMLSDGVAKKIEHQDELKKILEEEDVKLKKGKLKGRWNDVFAVGGRLLSYIPGFDFIGDFSAEQGSNFSSQSSIGGEENTTKGDQSGRSIKSDESFSVSPLFLRYIIAYHYEEYQKLENVSREISFEISETTSDRNLKIFARKDVDRKTFSETVDKFIGFYQNQNQKMVQETIKDYSKSRILEAGSRFSLVVDSAQKKNKMVLYGERENVQEALKFLKSEVGASTKSTASGPSTPRTASSSKEAAGESSPNPKSTAESKVIVHKLSCVLYQNVKVSVYQGDITKEIVDAIVNPANEDLEHTGGAAGAIVRAGGKSIQDESNKIMKKRQYKRLASGEVALTEAGNLPCKWVIHAVGPRWSDYLFKESAKRDLYNAVYNSLTVANHYATRSISIPAISSGIFGVPVGICAEVLFSAVIYFSQKASEASPLKEIRFVNIDKETTQVFAREMKRLYGASVTQESVELFHSKVLGNQKKIDQLAQNQFTAWKQNPTNNKKAAGVVASATFTGCSDTDRDNRGSKGGKSSLNPKAAAFSTSESPTPTTTARSYSNVLTGNSDKEKKDKAPGADAKGSVSGDDQCSICLSNITDKKTLSKCGHSFCAGCIDEAFKHQKKCPVCSTVYGTLIGDQPEGKMFVRHSSARLSGYESCGSITITYKFEDGVQGPEHPTPGKKYYGISRSAYLPDNDEGNKVLRLLQKAFDQKLTFTIGRSSTTGNTGVITWNDIHHKTRSTGGATSFGYPDPNYLKRVQEELAAKGITE